MVGRNVSALTLEISLITAKFLQNSGISNLVTQCLASVFMDSVPVSETEFPIFLLRLEFSSVPSIQVHLYCLET